MILLDEDIPFYVEERLEAMGARVESKEPFSPNVVVTEERLITGQNPQSSKIFAEKIEQVVRKYANKF